MDSSNNYDATLFAKKEELKPFQAIQVSIDEDIFLPDITLNKVFGEDMLSGQAKYVRRLNAEVKEMIAQNPELRESIVFEIFDAEEQNRMLKLEEIFLKHQKQPLERGGAGGTVPFAKDNPFLQHLEKSFERSLKYKQSIPNLDLFHRRLEYFEREMNANSHIDKLLQEIKPVKRSEMIQQNNQLNSLTNNIRTSNFKHKSIQQQSSLKRQKRLFDEEEERIDFDNPQLFLQQKPVYYSYKKRFEEEQRMNRINQMKRKQSKKAAEIRKSVSIDANKTKVISLRRLAMHRQDFGDQNSETFSHNIGQKSDMSDVNSENQVAVNSKLNSLVSKNAKNLLQASRENIGNPQRFNQEAKRIVTQYSNRIQCFSKVIAAMSVPKIDQLMHLNVNDIIPKDRSSHVPLPPSTNKAISEDCTIIPSDQADHAFLEVIDNTLATLLKGQQTRTLQQAKRNRKIDQFT